jgi:hypothetical protein
MPIYEIPIPLDKLVVVTVPAMFEKIIVQTVFKMPYFVHLSIFSRIDNGSLVFMCKKLAEILP